MLEDAKNSEKILEAKACACDSSHNLIVDLLCRHKRHDSEGGRVQSELRYGSVRDIAVIWKGEPSCLFRCHRHNLRTESGKPIWVPCFPVKKHNASALTHRFPEGCDAESIVPARVHASRKLWCIRRHRLRNCCTYAH